MLGAGRYLLGVGEVTVLVGLATLGAVGVRSRLLPGFAGAPAFLVSATLALAQLLWIAEILGSFGLFEPLPYLFGVALLGLALRLGVGGAITRPGDRREGPGAGGAARSRPHPTQTLARVEGVGPSSLATLIALAIAAVAVTHFAAGVRVRLSTGMTGFDSTWYHGPFAAGFFQTGNTFDLHYIAPQFLAWFYPANSEIFHAVGMVAFGRDLLSPLLNLGWFMGCLLAAWCIGRPYRVAAFSLMLAAVALSVPALADQAGEARNDLVGIFFLLTAVAVALNAGERRAKGELDGGALAVAGLAVGMAAGTKLTFLLPAAVLVVGLAALAPRGRRSRAISVVGLSALAGGGYWYLRNLVQVGNPLPWVDHIGPLSLPSPGQGLGGREAHDVLGYLGEHSIWSEWFLPGLHQGLWIFWPLLVAVALTGLLLSLPRPAGPLLRLAGLAGLAVVLSWLISPTSASGPSGMPHGFESGLRYLTPALVLGVALVAVVPPLNGWLLRWAGRGPRVRWSGSARWRLGGGVALVVLCIVLGYPLQRHYLQSRYRDPQFTTRGLDAAFRWARSISGARIATTSTRQYPLYGTDLSNRVEYLGAHRPHGGFVAISSCPAWLRAVNAGSYNYVVASRDRIEPGKPTYPPQARWTEAAGARVILRTPPTVVLELGKRLDPASCR